MSSSVLEIVELENGEIVADGQFPTVPANSTTIAQPDDELLKQFYLQHDPRLVTWELQGGTLVEIEPDDDEETQD